MSWSDLFQVCFLGVYAVGMVKLLSTDPTEFFERIIKARASRPKPIPRGNVGAAMRAATMPDMDTLLKEYERLKVAKEKAQKYHLSNLSGGYMALASDSEKGVKAIEKQMLEVSRQVAKRHAADHPDYY